ncbi:MAG TPA: molecular chaperone HtpG, partial [bacterium]|nr:molecular chaperone HtpG [bacterium]
AEKKYGKLIDLLKDQLNEEIKDVRVSARLKDSACCLVADEDGMDQNMERIMKALGQNVPSGKRTLEINPDHPLIGKMQMMFDIDKDQPLLKDYTALLYDQALVLEGSKPKDPVLFAKRIAEIMVKA